METKDIVSILRENNNFDASRIINSEEFKAEWNLKAEETFNNQPNGRTIQEVGVDVYVGLVLEFVIAEVLKGTRNPLAFDYSNSDTFYYDVDVNGRKIEVKSWGDNAEWQNFHLKNTQEYLSLKRQKRLGKYPDYKTLLDNADRVDLLICCSLSGNTVKFKRIVNPKIIKDKMRVSNTFGTEGGKSSHYFNTNTKYGGAVHGRDYLDL